MSARTQQNYKRSGRYNPQPDYTPVYGVKLYFAESGFLLSFIAILLFSLARIYMSSIEQKNAGSIDIFSVLGILASVFLLVGGLLTLLGAYVKSLSGIVIFSGLLLMLASNGIFCCCLALESMSESDILGVIQCLFEVLFLVSTFILIIVLIISCLNRRTAPSAAIFTTVMSLFAVALLLVRTFTTFASLSSALGSSFSWDQTSDLTTSVKWVLRSISADSDFAADMYYARFFERVTLILMYASFLSPVFRFSQFFRQYNIQMDISAEMPDARRNVKEQKGNPYASGKFDLLSGLHSLREKDAEQADQVDDDESEEIFTDEDISGFSTPDYISGYNEPQTPFFYEQHEEYYEPDVQPEPAVVYNTNMLDSDYGKPVESTDTANESALQNNEAPTRTESGAYRVKLKSSIPSPDDESIWDNYTD